VTARADADLEPDAGEPLVGIRLGQLHDVKQSELGMRFAFGACASAVAGVIALASTRFGGMFLAFPAILPATLTLLEKKHGAEAARHDLRGAVLGSLGLVAFAVTAAALFGNAPVGVVLCASTGAWVVVSVGSYLLTVGERRARAAGTAHPRDVASST
jgi:hypothetical protein